MLLVGLFIVYPYILFRKFSDMSLESYRVVDVRDVRPNIMPQSPTVKGFLDDDYEEQRMLIQPSE
jgi:hypothetical protein